MTPTFESTLQSTLAPVSPPGRLQAAWRQWRPQHFRWRSAAFIISLATLIPLLVVLSSFLRPQPEVWQHLAQYVLPGLLANTAWLLLGVGAGTLLLGVSLGWLVAVCEFPGRRFFSWALMLPLALPAYVSAFAAIGIFDFTGPLQTALREMGFMAGLPPIRSRGGVILVLTLSFYPYVYLLARNAFLSQGRRALEVGQSLGYSPWAGFFKIALPTARPWLFGGLLLVIMETLADFGTVAVFNYDTFTTAIYKAWFGMFSMAAASQLASLLVILVLLLAVAEQVWQRDRRYTATGKSALRRYTLTGQQKWAACAFASLVLLFAFALPVLQLLVWCVEVFESDFDSRYPGFVWHSVLLSAMAAALVVVCALVLAHTLRMTNDWPTRLGTRVATLGYAIPGTVLAVGVFIPVAWLDNQLLPLLQQYLGINLSSLLRGSLAVMLLAYLARFLAAGFNPIDSAMQRITRSQQEAAQGLGYSGWRLFRALHWGMLRGGLLSGALLVFVDVMKEMPITLMTRPFGWDTLAVRVFEMTSEGQWDRAALPAMALVLVGLVPVILLSRHAEH
jgi:iron(III) transport system permease protein